MDKKHPDERSVGEGPQVVGTSPGGSPLLEYGYVAPRHPRIGITDESTIELVELRESVYGEIFGEFDSVLHEMIPFIPHIDVYRFPPSSSRSYYTYVTGGMSNLEMNSPPKAGADRRRVELVFYSSDDKTEYAELLRRLAHFPHDNHTWLHWGHSMPNGTPAKPVFGSGPLDSLFFMSPIVTPDSELGDRLQWQGARIELLWCVPITTEECNVKLQIGTDALYALFNLNEHPFVFTGQRESYV